MYLVASPEVSCTGFESEHLELSQPYLECGPDSVWPSGLSTEMVALICNDTLAADTQKSKANFFQTIDEQSFHC